MLPLGTQAPEFSLIDVISEKTFCFNKHNSADAIVIMFICNHCPYVIHVNHELVRLANDYLSKNVQFIAINSNDIDSYPDDAPEKMRIKALELNYPFPYLFDSTQEVAQAYQARCTPDFYVFDKHHALVYRGQLDDSRPGNGLPLNGHSIREALDCLLKKEAITLHQKPSLGCNIKWKPGHEL